MGLLLYSEEHFSCSNYSRENSVVELLCFKKGVHELEAKCNYFAAVYSGNIFYSSGKIKEKEIKEGEMFVVPMQTKSTIRASEDSRLYLFRLNNVSFCGHFSFGKLNDYLKKDKNSLHTLKANSVVQKHFEAVEQYLSDGFRCVYFLELHLKTLLFLLRGYYKKEDLAALFYPILNKDMEFSELVFKNIGNAKTVKELAELMHYSFSGFEKRFKKVFGISAYKWMQDKLSREIYREINCSNKTMAEIAHQFGFSPSYFNDFCKRVFKVTPTLLRNNEEGD